MDIAPGTVCGRWTVVRRINSDVRGNARWLCVCECGERREVPARYLRNGRSRSCGCLDRELFFARSVAPRVKWQLSTYTAADGTRRRRREYLSWRNAKSRCTNPKDVNYWRYGGRGITMCDEWRHNYDAFAIAVGACPDGCTLERIDVNKGYEPGNVEWATPAQQARNTRASVKLTFRGETMCLTDWAARFGVHKNTLRYRLQKGSVEQVFGKLA